jgi:hypothetical protein
MMPTDLPSTPCVPAKFGWLQTLAERFSFFIDALSLHFRRHTIPTPQEGEPCVRVSVILLHSYSGWSSASLKCQLTR